MRPMLLTLAFVSAVMHSTCAGAKADEAPQDSPSPLTAPFDQTKARGAQDAWANRLGRSSHLEKNSIGMELVLIPPGTFRMGSPGSEEGRKDNEAQVDVTLTKPFYLGREEVTQRQWRAVMGTSPWKVRKGSEYVREGDQYPAIFVSWDDAQEFCRKLSEKEEAKYRLPSEAEWEYACRAGTVTRFCFGDGESELGRFAWFAANAWKAGEQYAHEAGLTQPNPFELHDMHGNVREWCQDVYVEELPGGTDPLVSVGSERRVFRGGDWGLKGVYCRSACRLAVAPSTRNYFFGFRVARNAGP